MASNGPVLGLGRCQGYDFNQTSCSAGDRARAVASKGPVLELARNKARAVTSNRRLGLYNNFQWTRARQGCGLG